MSAWRYEAAPVELVGNWKTPLIFSLVLEATFLALWVLARLEKRTALYTAIR